MQILNLIDGKLSLAHVTPVIRAIFAPFGVQDDGTLNPKTTHPMWLDLIPFLRTLMDTMGVPYPADDTSVAMVNAIARHLGKPDAMSGGEQGGDGDGASYTLVNAFDLAVALDDNHGLIKAVLCDAEHGRVANTGGLDSRTVLITRHVDLYERGELMQQSAEALHDALRRKNYRGAAALMETDIQMLLLRIRDSKAREKVKQLIQFPPA